MSVSSGNRIIVCKKVNRASNSKTVKQCIGNWTGVTTQDFIKFWGKIFVFILLVLIENSQGFKTVEFN
jgi:hypothetical protein